MDEKFELRIQEVSKKLEIPRSTIRYWESEFPSQIQPRRTNGGQRRYTSEAISAIEDIRIMREMGMTLAEIRRKLETCEKEDGFENSNKIDFLVNRVAKIVRGEVSQFLRRELSNNRP